MTSLKVLVTGANGFVGEALILKMLVDKKFCPIATARRAIRLNGLCPVRFYDMSRTDSLPCLDDIDVVVHAAARVHVMTETSEDPLAEFRKFNVDGTLALANLAAKSGVKRFIFISSIKVNGEVSTRFRPFTADCPPSPVDFYGVSKFEAERALKKLHMDSGMEVVIIRPPLIYGPKVKGNFLTLLDFVKKGIPLPFGLIKKKRSLVSIGNLVSLIITCIEHPAAANQVFLVSDGRDLTLAEMMTHLSLALGQTVKVFPVPTIVLYIVLSIFGKRSVAQRLCGSLQVDIDKNRKLLGWVPSVKVEDAMRQTAEHFLREI